MRSERLVASSADREFTAKLTLPKGAGPFPAIVCIHPASDGTRDHFLFLHLEGLLPALESSHAVAEAIRRAPEAKGEVFIVNLSGRGDKDIDIYRENFKDLDDPESNL